MTLVQLARSLHLAALLDREPTEGFDITMPRDCALGRCGEATGFRAFRNEHFPHNMGQAIVAYFGLPAQIFCYPNDTFTPEQADEANLQASKAYGGFFALWKATPADVARVIRECCNEQCAAERHAQLPEPLRSVVNSFCPPAP